MIDKKSLSERDICTKFITPAIEKAGWNKLTQLLEEVFFTDGKIYVRDKLTARGEAKRADYILYYKPNIPVAIIEAKDNNHSVRAGIQQALSYAETLDIPCGFSSNGDGFLFHDRTATEEESMLPVLDPETGKEIKFEKAKIRYPDGRQPDGTWIVKEPGTKIYVNGVDVSVLVSRELYFDQQGRPITGSLKDHTKKIIKGKFASLDDFLNHWNNTEIKEAIIKELQDQGILVEALMEAVQKQVGLFDLICHMYPQG